MNGVEALARGCRETFGSATQSRTSPAVGRERVLDVTRFDDVSDRRDVGRELRRSLRHAVVADGVRVIVTSELRATARFSSRWTAQDERLLMADRSNSVSNVRS